MRKPTVASAFLLSISLLIGSAPFVSAGSAIPVPENTWIDPTVNGPLYNLDYSTGLVKRLDPSTGTLVTMANGWPTYPQGLSLTQQVRLRKTTTGDLVALAIFDDNDGYKHLWISLLSNAGWSAWQQLPQGDGNASWMNVEAFEKSGSTLAFTYEIHYDNNTYRTYLGTNYGGSWHSMLLVDSSQSNYDVISPTNPVSVSGQTSLFWLGYSVPDSDGWAPLEIKNNKVALVGTAFFNTSNFQSLGNTVHQKARNFTQIIDLTTMSVGNRTYLGGEIPRYAYDAASTLGTANEYPNSVWWNNAQNNVNVLVSRSETPVCPETPVGLDDFTFAQGSCYTTSTEIQYVAGAGQSLLSLTARNGERPQLDGQIMHTSTGLVGLFSSWHRAINVDGQGQSTGFTNDKASHGKVWANAKPDGTFDPVSITEVQSADVSYNEQHQLRNFQGAAFDAILACQESSLDGDHADCSQNLSIYGEGKSQDFYEIALNTDTESTDGSFDLAPTGSKIALITYFESFDANTSEWHSFNSITPDVFTPNIVKLSATLKAVAKTLKVKKSLSLPVVTLQNHAVTWSVAKASKTKCSLSVTKVNGVTTKVLVKGLKTGTCSLVAQAPGGVFYKALKKTVVITIK